MRRGPARSCARWGASPLLRRKTGALETPRCQRTRDDLIHGAHVKNGNAAIRQTKLPRERRTRGTRGSAAPSAAERRRKHVTDGVVRLSAAGLQAAGLNDFEMGDPLPQLQRVANLKTPVLPAFRECPPRIVAMRGDAGHPFLDWLHRVSIGDFAATLSGDDEAAAEIVVRRATLEFEKYFSNEPRKAFDWPIHPKGFRAPELLELGKQRAWTLKPAADIRGLLSELWKLPDLLDLRCVGLNYGGIASDPYRRASAWRAILADRDFTSIDLDGVGLPDALDLEQARTDLHGVGPAGSLQQPQ